MSNVDGSIENLTDQLEGFTQEVEREVSKLVQLGYTVDQAITIVKIGVEDIKAETMHHFNTRMYELIAAYEARTENLISENR